MRTRAPNGKVYGRLSAPMREVLKLLADGWQGGRSGGYGAGAWLQKGKIGYGGESRDARQDTVFALYKRGLIAFEKKNFHTSTFDITPAGREALASSEGAAVNR